MTAFYSEEERLKLISLLSLVNEQQQPNTNALNEVARNINILSLNLKSLGYDLARRMAEALPVRTDTVATPVGLASKLSTQADMESAWVAHWCAQLQTPVLYHRKMWELAYVLQAMFEEGHIRAGQRGLGFGCGTEPIPSYLAAHDVAVTVTDLPPEEAYEKGWSATNQHTASLEQAFNSKFIDRARFDRLVELRQVDMNAIPKDLTDYDFCWSVCALEHVGTIRQGLDFIRNSLKTLRPGGLAVHTTEYNIDPNGPTIDNWATVLFQKHHFEELAASLRAEGHFVAPLDFDLGTGVLDRFIDLPPWSHDLPPELNELIGHPAHLKLGVDGFVCTCFGILVRKAE